MTGTVAAARAVAPTVLTSDQFERRLVSRINLERAELGGVRPGGCVDRYAEQWARHLKRTGSFRHRDQHVILKGCHTTYAGEIMAKGYRWPKGMVDAWMKSNRHRKVLMSLRTHQRAGLAAVHTRDGRWLAVVDFIQR